jgi:hypothetical protein
MKLIALCMLSSLYAAPVNFEIFKSKIVKAANDAATKVGSKITESRRNHALYDLLVGFLRG